MRTKKMLLIALSLMMVLVISSTAMAKNYKIKFGHVLAPGSHYQKLAVKFKELVEDSTDGQVEVQIFPSAQLGGERAIVEQMKMGSVQMSITAVAPLSAWNSKFSAFTSPYLVESLDQGRALLEGSFGDKLLGFLPDMGLVGLGWVEYGFRNVYNSKRPIEKPEDLDGLKLRVPEDPGMVAAYESLGVNPTPMSYGEVYSAIEQGVIDGGETDPQQFIDDRFIEVANNFALTKVTYYPVVLVIAQNFYDMLPVGLQYKVQNAADLALDYQYELWRELNDKAIAKMEEEGVVVTYPDLGAFKEATKDVDKVLAKKIGKGGEEWMKEIRAAAEAAKMKLEN